MSGMAGARIESEFFALFLNDNRLRAHLAPPGAPPGYLAHVYEEANRPYAEWLGRALEDVVRLVGEAIQVEQVPIVKFQTLPVGRKARAKSRLQLETLRGGTVGDRRFELSVVVSEKLSDAQAQALIQGVTAVLARHSR